MMDWQDQLIETIDQQTWLDDIAKPTQKKVRSLFAAGGEAGIKIRDFLHGVWLGHPLHAVLVDLPIGFYTSTVALDVLEMASAKPGVGQAADAALSLGIVSAVGAAAAGITDWQHTAGSARRLGALHGLINTAALALFIGSRAARKGRAQGRGRALAATGMAASAAAAYLGGHLVYSQKIGVDHAPDPTFAPNKFTPVIEEALLGESELVRVDLNNESLLLVKRGSRIYALAERCAHLGGPLAEGHLEGEAVVCPWHGSQFALEDGAVLQGPSNYRQPCFETRVRKGMVEVRRSPGTAG